MSPKLRPHRHDAPLQLSQTARVLLGMIAEGHGTGYSIKAEIERSTRVYWGASIGGIYPELRRLQGLGLLAVRDDPRGGGRRHAYALTPAGRRALRDWLAADDDPSLEIRHEALLRLRFAGVLDASRREQILQRLRGVHERRAASLRTRLRAGAVDDPFHALAIEFSLGLDDWAVRWCDDALARFDSA